MSAYTDYLEHHGIRGQRWGRRNGPPYPLDSSDHSADEKAGKRSPNSSLAGDSHKKSKPKVKKTEVSKSNKKSNDGKKKKGTSRKMQELKARKPKKPACFY